MLDAPGGEFQVPEPKFADDLCFEVRKVVGLGERLADHVCGRNALGRRRLVDGRSVRPDRFLLRPANETIVRTGALTGIAFRVLWVNTH
ncbi:hypothetical protein [Streptomyces sp. NPDC003697]